MGHGAWGIGHWGLGIGRQKYGDYIYGIFGLRCDRLTPRVQVLHLMCYKLAVACFEIKIAGII